MNEFKFNLHDTLVVELIDDCYSGELVFFNKAGTLIELDNVRNLNTNETVEGVQKFYRNEIVKLTSLNEEGPAAVPTDAVDLPKRAASYSSSHLTPAQLKHITGGIEEAMFIDHVDRTYRDAMKCLQKSDWFAVSISTEFRPCSSVVSMITVCTSDQRIFLLDILSIGRVPVELKDLLQARVPRKIMHNSSVAAFILKTDCGVQLNGVFDTMVRRKTCNFGTAPVFF